MAKKTTPNYDNTLVGRYIRQIENPDSAGWNPSSRIWVAPSSKGYDPNNRGMGVDVIYNETARQMAEGRPGRYLTEEEERQLRNKHIDYSLGALRRNMEKKTGVKKISPRKEAETVGLIYRGDASEIWDGNTKLGKAFRSGNDKEFHNAVEEYYQSKKLNERARNNDSFWEQNKEPSPHKGIFARHLNQWDTLKYKYGIKAFGGPLVQQANMFGGGGFKSELDWSPESWFVLRVPKPDGTLYNEEEAKILSSHVPEYLEIERVAKNNGSWLKMPDGSTYEGDPRGWVMMQSKAYNKNYSQQPWYTGQAEWPTQYDYGQGIIDTNKVTRAPYYDNQMWFSDSKDYGETFANYVGSDGTGWRFDRLGEEDIRGKNFIAAIPKAANYRTLESSSNTPDYWRQMPFILENNTINRLPSSEIVERNRNGVSTLNRADGQKVLTDDVVNWSKDLGDDGIFMGNVEDGPVIKDGYIINKPINEFISQPGFTKKVKFIEGNTGDFNIDNPYKYALNNYQNDEFNYAAKGGPLNTHKQWQDLPIKERADIMKVAIRNGITNLADIKAKYNEFALGGQLEEPNLYEESDESNIYSKGSWLRKKTQAISKATKIPVASKKSTPMSNSSAYAMQYFINKGLAPHQAAGLVGNLMRESGLNPLAINPGSKAYGLAQWLGARKKKLFSMYGNKPTLQNQLDFVWWELNNTHKNGLKHLMAARNAEEAARAGMNWFEFSNGDAISEMNKWGQDGRGSMRKGIEFATKLAGQPMPDLAYLDTPNLNMQQSQTYGQMPMGYGYPMQQPQNDNNTFLAFEPSNPQAFFAPLSSYETPVEQTPTQPLVDVAEQQYKAEMAERQRVMQQNNNMLALVSYLNNSGNQDSSPFGVFNLLSGNQIEV